MDFKKTPAMSPALLEGRFAGRIEFADLIRDAFAAAACQGWREIILCDANFEDWPLGERVVDQALNDWSESGRKLTMLANNYDEIARRHTRFVTWRRTWSHIVNCQRMGSAPDAGLPSALWSPNWVFERLDLQRCAGIAGSEALRRLALRERLDQRLMKSFPAFPSTTLGL